MARVSILNSITNVVENVYEVEDINNVPSFLIAEGQVLATDHTGEIGDTWNGSSYDKSHREIAQTIDEKWEAVRGERNKFLAETDWTQFADSPLTAEQKYSYAEYRQQLRDLPSSTSNPDDVVWPVKPE